jgi:hypothetical protein
LLHFRFSVYRPRDGGGIILMAPKRLIQNIGILSSLLSFVIGVWLKHKTMILYYCWTFEKNKFIFYLENDMDYGFFYYKYTYNNFPDLLRVAAHYHFKYKTAWQTLWYTTSVLFYQQFLSRFSGKFRVKEQKLRLVYIVF